MVKRENINTTKHAHITMNIRVGRTVGRTVINPKHNKEPASGLLTGSGLAAADSIRERSTAFPFRSKERPCLSKLQSI